MYMKEVSEGTQEEWKQSGPSGPQTDPLSGAWEPPALRPWSICCPQTVWRPPTGQPLPPRSLARPHTSHF